MRISVGKTLAYTSITFTNNKGQLAARGSHTKYDRPFSTPQAVLTLDYFRYVAGAIGEDGPFVAPAEYTEDVD